jgi:hypothetical protein
MNPFILVCEIIFPTEHQFKRLFTLQDLLRRIGVRTRTTQGWRYVRLEMPTV